MIYVFILLTTFWRFSRSAQVLRVNLTKDAGRSLNQEVDIGQIEGAFVMAIGWGTTENVVYDSVPGKLLANGTLEYKPPTAADIPTDFRVTFLRKTPNPFGVLCFKGKPEPNDFLLHFGDFCPYL
ncbi:unnamed protein product [Allacma fusca]|uniref:Aldehyde oxidase/xanthine dehydrogenase second molybdopterin binding domain-containing protein n=1 Tax=Allacma fusca TaxID=39272 RepID=A0A8J2JFJ6_9HEXA|nr:unnamed protein product [Allacma fusca]